MTKKETLNQKYNWKKSFGASYSCVLKHRLHCPMDWLIRGKSLCYLAKFDFIQSVCNTVFILVLWYGLMLQLSQEMEFVVVKLFCLPAFPRSRFIFHSRVSNQCDRIISKVVGKWKFQQLVFHNTRGTSCERQQSGASRGFQDLTNAPSGKFVILLADVMLCHAG